MAWLEQMRHCGIAGKVRRCESRLCGGPGLAVRREWLALTAARSPLRKRTPCPNETRLLLIEYTLALTTVDPFIGGNGNRGSVLLHGASHWKRWASALPRNLRGRPLHTLGK